MQNEKLDGRVGRSVRSRQAIIEAMIELMYRGIYIPTAQQVADQAKISIRTVFRHFTEMEHLYKELDEVMRPSYERHFVIGDYSGTVRERATRLIELFINGYVEFFQLEKAVHALFWRSPSIKESYINNQKLLRKVMLKVLPELKTSQKEFAIEIADAITSFEYFDRLYSYQELSVENCKKILTTRMIELLDY